MEINLADSDLVRVCGANRTLRVVNRGSHLYATTPAPGAGAILEILRDGRVCLLLFDHGDDLRRWVAFTKKKSSAAFRVNADGTLEKIEDLNDIPRTDPGRFIVELESGVWLDVVETGDPGRTLVKENAEVFTSRAAARSALELARSHRVFKDARIDVAPETCSTCGGRGRMSAQADRDAMVPPCGRCDGTGKVDTVAGNEYGRAICPDCNGTGEVDSGGLRTTQECSTCDGTGRADVPSVSDVGNPCVRCDGKGVIDSVFLPGQHDQWIELPCPDCHGHVDDGAPKPPECVRCNGTGKVEAFAPHDDEMPPTVGMNGGRCLLEIDPEVHRAGMEAATRRARGETDPCPECEGTGKRPTA